MIEEKLLIRPTGGNKSERLEKTNIDGRRILSKKGETKPFKY